MKALICSLLFLVLAAASVVAHYKEATKYDVVSRAILAADIDLLLKELEVEDAKRTPDTILYH
jgi:hypothetical protein